MKTKGLSERWRFAKQKATEKVLSSPRIQRVLVGDLGNRELISVAISVLVIVIILMISVFVGKELEDAADVGTNGTWKNVSNATGELGETASSILKVGVIENQLLKADFRPNCPSSSLL